MINPILLRCYICGNIIQGSYYRDWADHPICIDHKDVCHCVSCGQFCNIKSIDIGNGSRLCSYCQEHMMTKEDCKYIVRFVNRIYSNTVMGEIHNWNLKTIDAVALHNRTGSKNIRGLAERCGDKYTVFVYRQLSKVQFANVLAHELLHIWLYNRGVNPIPIMCEGFCNLGSYVVLSNINNSEAKATLHSMIVSSDPIYGDGLRICKTMFDKGGWREVIKALEKNQEK